MPPLKSLYNKHRNWALGRSAKLPDYVMEFLEVQDITFMDWCEKRGFNWNTARDVAIGRIRGYAGISLKIKRALKEERGRLEIDARQGRENDAF